MAERTQFYIAMFVQSRLVPLASIPELIKVTRVVGGETAIRSRMAR